MRTDNELVLVPQLVETRPEMNPIHRNFIEDAVIVSEVEGVQDKNGSSDISRDSC